MSDTEEVDEYISLGEFLSEHYQQFATMGIFGTISVFLSDGFPRGSETLSARAAIFASLSIFALIAAWVCFQSLDQLLDRVNDTASPFLTDVGFVIIILSTATLTGAIVNAILTYSEIIDFAQLIFIPAIGLLFYSRHFPSSRYDVGDIKAVFIPYWSFVPIIPIAEQLFSNTLRFFYFMSQSNILAYVLTTAFGLCLHLTICESYLGIYRLKENIDLKRPILRPTTLSHNLKELKKIRSKWSFPVSILLGTIGLVIHGIGFTEISNQYTSNIIIFGYSWFIYILVFNIIFSSITAIVIWNCRSVDEVPDSVERIARYIGILLLAGSIIVLLLVHFEIIGEPQWGY